MQNTPKTIEDTLEKLDEIALTRKTSINGALIQIWDSNVLGAFIQQALSEQDCISRESERESLVEATEKMLVNTPEEVAELNKHLPSTIQEQSYLEAIGYTKAIKDIIHLINSK